MTHLWATRAPGTFRAHEAIAFAQSEGWVCTRPTEYSAAQLGRWQYAGRPVFPLHFGPAERAPDNAAVSKFPRYISETSLVFACRTGWMRVEPGTDDASDALGYVQIEESGARMAVYHLWGEI